MCGLVEHETPHEWLLVVVWAQNYVCQLPLRESHVKDSVVVPTKRGECRLNELIQQWLCVCVCVCADLRSDM